MKKFNFPGIDRGTDRRLARGEYDIDMRLDLHGLTLDEAFERFSGAVERASRAGLRCILVITGKGIHSDSGRSTIKSSFPGWIDNYSFIGDRVVTYRQASPRHGGSGAYYVLLKKNRTMAED